MSSQIYSQMAQKIHQRQKQCLENALRMSYIRSTWDALSSPCSRLTSAFSACMLCTRLSATSLLLALVSTIIACELHGDDGPDTGWSSFCCSILHQRDTDTILHSGSNVAYCRGSLNLATKWFWLNCAHQWFVSYRGFNVMLDTLRVISEMIFPGHQLTGAKICFIWTSGSAGVSEHNISATMLQHRKPKQQFQLQDYQCI